MGFTASPLIISKQSIKPELPVVREKLREGREQGGREREGGNCIRILYIYASHYIQIEYKSGKRMYWI